VSTSDLFSQRSRYSTLPVDGAGDDGRLVVYAVLVERRRGSPGSWLRPAPDLPVVVGATGRVAEHRVGDEDQLERRVG
jgi:hypothetical protein